MKNFLFLATQTEGHEEIQPRREEILAARGLKKRIEGGVSELKMEGWSRVGLLTRPEILGRIAALFRRAWAEGGENLAREKKMRDVSYAEEGLGKVKFRKCDQVRIIR